MSRDKIIPFGINREIELAAKMALMTHDFFSIEILNP
jgi:hypothetical protein